VRIEVPNAGGELRLGMYADVVVAGASGTSTPRVPRSAVQNVGDRTVVYLANPKEPGKFIEREVRRSVIRRTSRGRVSVKPGDVVVTEGSFFVRAERERLGLRPAAAGPSATPSRAPAATSREDVDATVQSVKILVNEQGYEPAKVTLHAGVPARLRFLGTTTRRAAQTGVSVVEHASAPAQ